MTLKLTKNVAVDPSTSFIINKTFGGKKRNERINANTRTNAVLFHRLIKARDDFMAEPYMTLTVTLVSF